MVVTIDPVPRRRLVGTSPRLTLTLGQGAIYMLLLYILGTIVLAPDLCASEPASSPPDGWLFTSGRRSFPQPEPLWLLQWAAGLPGKQHVGYSTL